MLPEACKEGIFMHGRFLFMNNRKVNMILGLVATVVAIVSVLVLFATAFGASDVASHPSTLGSCFNVMFGNQGFNAVPMLIVAFVLQLVAAFFMLIGAILPGKLGMFGLGLAGVCLAVAGVFWLMAPNFFKGANTVSADVEAVVNGTGTILAAVFSFLGALLGLYGAYRTFKA